jgi:hypothetical protein
MARLTSIDIKQFINNLRVIIDIYSHRDTI